MFCAVLAWSRYRFVRFGADQTRETTLELLTECFEELDGVPAVVLTDRMACLRAGIVANVVVPHPEYVQFATYFGFKADFCEGADPESKGVVENLCGYVQTDLLIPALLEPEWPDLAAANVAARTWCAEVNSQVHSEICAVPNDRLLSKSPCYGHCRPAVHRSAPWKAARSTNAAVFGSGRHAIWCERPGRRVRRSRGARREGRHPACWQRGGPP
jgi:hypothetical protein